MILGNDHWYNAYIATIIISVLPNLLLLFIPFAILKEKTYRGLNVKHILMCFAAAGLLGDVFLHTIPHLISEHHHHGAEALIDAAGIAVADILAHSHDHGHLDSHSGHSHAHDFEGHNHDHGEHDHHEHEHQPNRVLNTDHEHESHNDSSFSLYSALGLERNLVIQLVVVSGFLLFFAAEKIATGYAGHSHSHSHSHSHGTHKEHDEEKPISPSTATATTTTTSCASDGKEKSRKSTTRTSSSSLLQAMREKLQASGWLNLLADSMHNFTDGIAIGASFASSGSGLGFATFVSVVFHEIPHEIGDFTILINNGLR
jgi:zinc transporter 7